MWAGLKTLTDYKKKISSAEVMSASLPDELEHFLCTLRAPLQLWRLLDLTASPAELSRCVQTSWQRLRRHFQPLTAPVCSPHMLQGDHHCPQENPTILCLNDDHPVASPPPP
ncbi:hypothetical protein L3Q82_010072 [Scortum barcoo]|uniref:Uncharacterized protein n=1 Tax=Scortum barcoo TaxID=214431 RepID=A0ACB8WC32_9TELE|nr:hypothetical protein L3Q82_010072 [Scortum barcoo]